MLDYVLTKNKKKGNRRWVGLLGGAQNKERYIKQKRSDPRHQRRLEQRRRQRGRIQRYGQGAKTISSIKKLRRLEIGMCLITEEKESEHMHLFGVGTTAKSGATMMNDK